MKASLTPAKCASRYISSKLVFHPRALAIRQVQPTAHSAASTSSALQARTNVLSSMPGMCPAPRVRVTTSATPSGTSPTEEVAILGGGCFWCVEACYNQLRGVYSAVSGYAGGHVANPTYEQVCGKRTGHAEVVRVKFDPSVISFKTILEVFFTIHDPTTKDRQGNDVGPQYRSIIMFANEEQKKVAEQVMAEVTQAKVWRDPIVTELVPASTFYEGEQYHQRYYEQNPTQGYCAYVVGPKVTKFRSKWNKYIKSSSIVA